MPPPKLPPGEFPLVERLLADARGSKSADATAVARDGIEEVGANGDRRTWQNLMNDPAYPAIAAMLGTGAVLAATPADASEKAKVKLNLKAAPAPKVDWDGITQSILQKDADLKKIQMTKQELGLSPDLFPEPEERHIGAVIQKWIKKQNPVAHDAMYGMPDISEPGWVEKAIDPVLKGGFETFMSGAGGISPDGKPRPAKGAAVPVLRAAGQMVAGRDQFLSRVEDPEMVKGINQMEEKLGVKGTAVALTVADILGQTLLMIIGAGKTVHSAAASGAVTALAMPDVTIGEGAALGAGFKYAGDALGALYGKAAEVYAAGKAAVPGIKKRIFGATPSAGAWEKAAAKAKGAAAPVEDRLVAVVTKDGMQRLNDDVAKSLAFPKTKAPLPAGAQRVMSVAAFDELGNPVLKTSFYDPTNPLSPSRVEVEPLTVASALAAKKANPPSGTGMSIDFQRRWGAGEYADLGNAIFGLGTYQNDMGKTQVAGYRKLSEALLDDPAAAVALDYRGTNHTPVGGEVRINAQGGIKITPVFDDIRLPDEVPPPKSLVPTKNDLAPLENTIVTSEQPTQTMSYLDMNKIRPGLPIGGGSGGKPPPEGVRPVGSFDDEADPVDVKSIFKTRRNLEGPRKDQPDSGETNETLTPVRPGEAKLLVRADVDPDAPVRPKPIFKSKTASEPHADDVDEFIRIKGPEVPDKTITPQGPPSLANVSPATVADLNGVMKRIGTLVADKSGVDKALSLIAGRHLRGPVDLASTVTSIQASNQMAKIADDVRGAFEKYFPKGLLDQSNLDLHKYMEGQLTEQEFFGKYPDLNREAQEFSRGIFEEIQYWDKFFASKGVVRPELAEMRENGSLPLYITRRFWSRLLPPKAWMKKSWAPGQKEIFEKGVARIVKDMNANSPQVPYHHAEGNVRTKEYLPTVRADDVAAEVVKMMNADDPVTAFVNSGIGRPYSALKAKNRDLPEEILAMLGEVRSGTVSASMTIGMQRANASRLMLMEEISANNSFTSPIRDIAAGLTYQLPDDPSMFAARGLWTNQAIFEALGNGPKITESSHRILHAIQRLVKGHQVVGGLIGPHLNSLTDNLKGGVLAGGIDFTRPHKAMPDMYRAARALIDYKKDPTGRTGRGGLVLDAKRTGADYFGFGHEEINNPASLKFMKDVNEAYPNPTGNVIERTTDLLLRGMKGYERGLAWLGGGLDWVDRLFRLQSYISLQDKYLADLAKNGANSYLMKAGLITPTRMDSYQLAATEMRTMKFNAATRAELNSIQRDVHEAAGRLASRRVNQSFWNPTFVGSGVERLRKSGVGIITPYATATFESWRVNGQLLYRMRPGTDEPDLKWRVLTSLIAMGGASGMALAYSGVTKEELDQTEAEIPDSKKTYRPGAFPLTWHDDKGRVQYWNATSWTEMSRLMQGDPNDPMAAKIISNLIMSPIQGGLADRPARVLFEKAGVLTPVGTPDRPTGVSESGAISVLSYLHSAGAFPSSFQQMANAARRTDIGSDGSPQFLGPTIGEYVPPLGDLIGQPSPYEEILTPMEGSLKAFGISNQEPVSSGDVDPYGRPNPSRMASDIEAQMELGKKGSLVKEVKKIFRSTKSQDSKDSDADEVKAEMEKRAKAYREKLERRKR